METTIIGGKNDEAYDNDGFPIPPSPDHPVLRYDGGNVGWINRNFDETRAIVEKHSGKISFTFVEQGECGDTVCTLYSPKDNLVDICEYYSPTDIRFDPCSGWNNIAYRPVCMDKSGKCYRVKIPVSRTRPNDFMSPLMLFGSKPHDALMSHVITMGHKFSLPDTFWIGAFDIETNYRDEWKLKLTSYDDPDAVIFCICMSKADKTGKITERYVLTSVPENLFLEKVSVMEKKNKDGKWIFVLESNPTVPVVIIDRLEEKAMCRLFFWIVRRWNESGFGIMAAHNGCAGSMVSRKRQEGDPKENTAEKCYSQKECAVNGFFDLHWLLHRTGLSNQKVLPTYIHVKNKHSKIPGEDSEEEGSFFHIATVPIAGPRVRFLDSMWYLSNIAGIPGNVNFTSKAHGNSLDDFLSAAGLPLKLTNDDDFGKNELVQLMRHPDTIVKGNGIDKVHSYCLWDTESIIALLTHSQINLYGFISAIMEVCGVPLSTALYGTLTKNGQVEFSRTMYKKSMDYVPLLPPYKEIEMLEAALKYNSIINPENPRGDRIPLPGKEMSFYKSRVDELKYKSFWKRTHKKGELKHSWQMSEEDLKSLSDFTNPDWKDADEMHGGLIYFLEKDQAAVISGAGGSFDWAGLYSSIMMLFNICPGGFARAPDGSVSYRGYRKIPEWYDEKIHNIWKNDHFSEKWSQLSTDGSVREMGPINIGEKYVETYIITNKEPCAFAKKLMEFRELRKKYKKEAASAMKENRMDDYARFYNLQLIIKLIMNSTYGNFIADGSWLMYPHIAHIVTAIGRAIALEHTKTIDGSGIATVQLFETDCPYFTLNTPIFRLSKNSTREVMMAAHNELRKFSDRLQGVVRDYLSKSGDPSGMFTPIEENSFVRNMLIPCKNTYICESWMFKELPSGEWEPVMDSDGWKTEFKIKGVSKSNSTARVISSTEAFLRSIVTLATEQEREDAMRIFRATELEKMRSPETFSSYYLLKTGLDKGEFMAKVLSHFPETLGNLDFRLTILTVDGIETLRRPYWDKRKCVDVSERYVPISMITDPKIIDIEAVWDLIYGTNLQKFAIEHVKLKDEDSVLSIMDTELDPNCANICIWSMETWDEEMHNKDGDPSVTKDGKRRIRHKHRVDRRIVQCDFKDVSSFFKPNCAVHAYFASQESRLIFDIDGPSAYEKGIPPSALKEFVTLMHTQFGIQAKPSVAGYNISAGLWRFKVSYPVVAPLKVLIAIVSAFWNLKPIFKGIDRSIYSARQSNRLPMCPKVDESGVDNSRINRFITSADVDVFGEICRSSFNQRPRLSDFIPNNIAGVDRIGFGLLSLVHMPEFNIPLMKIERLSLPNVAHEWLKKTFPRVKATVVKSPSRANRYLITLEAAHDIECPFCQRVHDKSHLFVDIDLKSIRIWCFRANIDQDNGAGESKAPVIIKFDKTRELRDYSGKWNEYYQECLKKAPAVLGETDYTLYDLEKPIIVVHAGLGSGKTTQMINHVDTALKNDPAAKIVLLSPRRVSVTDQQAKFSKEGAFKDYRDCGDRISLDKFPLLSIQEDSIWKILSGTITNISMVVIDEFVSIVKRLPKINKNKAFPCIDTFINLIISAKNTGRLGIMDGMISPMYKEMIKTLTGASEEEIQPVTKHGPHHEYHCAVYQATTASPLEYNNYYQMILKRIEEGYSVVSHCSSKSVAEGLYKYLGESYVSARLGRKLKVAYVIGSDFKVINDPEYTDPVESLKSMAKYKRSQFVRFTEHLENSKPDLLLYTEAMTVGISIVTKTFKFGTFVHYLKPSFKHDPTEIAQALDRCRSFEHPELGVIYIDPNPGHGQRVAQYQLDNLMVATLKRTDGLPKFAEQFQILINFIHEWSSEHSIEILIYLLTNGGYRLRFVQRQESKAPIFPALGLVHRIKRGDAESSSILTEERTVCHKTFNSTHDERIPLDNLDPEMNSTDIKASIRIATGLPCDLINKLTGKELTSWVNNPIQARITGQWMMGQQLVNIPPNLETFRYMFSWLSAEKIMEYDLEKFKNIPQIAPEVILAQAKAERDKLRSASTESDLIIATKIMEIRNLFGKRHVIEITRELRQSLSNICGTDLLLAMDSSEKYQSSSAKIRRLSLHNRVKLLMAETGTAIYVVMTDGIGLCEAGNGSDGKLLYKPKISSTSQYIINITAEELSIMKEAEREDHIAQIPEIIDKKECAVRKREETKKHNKLIARYEQIEEMFKTDPSVKRVPRPDASYEYKATNKSKTVPKTKAGTGVIKSTL